ncbi:transketolase family protein [Floccifex sp.]|uniref:transketolase family protein n=1 Tax=Floccifex sp. TaxID=2815810 RepID=UPI002A7633E3|nr:transketolase C-terminal domain-containing protein [Floccifex sp.]MDD7280900.1 transketolase C-terminal domain-containing protein [Erysipelotrichaceae bacterium]MDY2958571.1 transketolase C-terminal domain-containing protein [Floccifex sp.]
MAKIATRIAYGDALKELLQENPNIVVLDADLAGSTKSGEAKKVDPSRHFDMGIAEGNMMSVAAGLAASGKIAFASSFAMFATGRAYEQIRNSIGYTNLNVKVCASHAGISVGEDGASHQCIEDISLMRGIPGMKVIVPCDYNEAKQAVKAVAYTDGPCYVRLGRSGVETVTSDDYKFELGKGVVLKEGSKVALVATGLMVQEALEAYDKMEVKPTVVNMHTIKPIDADLIKQLAANHDTIVTCEEHSIIGGLGSAVAEVLAEAGTPCKLVRVGIQDTFGESGKPNELFEKYHIDADAIVQAASK